MNPYGFMTDPNHGGGRTEGAPAHPFLVGWQAQQQPPFGQGTGGFLPSPSMSNMMMHRHFAAIGNPDGRGGAVGGGGGGVGVTEVMQQLPSSGHENRGGDGAGGGMMMGMNPHLEAGDADVNWAFDSGPYGAAARITNSNGGGAGGGGGGGGGREHEPSTNHTSQSYMHHHHSHPHLPETFQQLVSQLLPPHSHMNGSDACHIIAEKVLRMYEAKESDIQILEQTIQDLETSNQQKDDEVSQLRKMLADSTDKNKNLREEIVHTRDILVSSANDGLQDIIPVRIAGNVSTAEVQERLGGYVSRKLLEETVIAANEAVQDPSVDPFQRFMDGAIVGEDLNHPSIEHIVSKFGMKIAHLVAEKKREITHQGPQTAYSTALLWEDNRELHVSEVVLRLINALRDARTTSSQVPTTTTTTSGRRVTLNPRLYDGADGEYTALLSSSSEANQSKAMDGGAPGGRVKASSRPSQASITASAGSGHRPSGGMSSAGDHLSASPHSSNPAGRKMQQSKKRRARAPVILTANLRAAFTSFMMQNSTMSESSALMFSGAANSLVHRVMVEVEGEPLASLKLIDEEKLKDIIQKHAAVFERQTKNAYANLPRIWKLLQAFTGIVVDTSDLSGTAMTESNGDQGVLGDVEDCGGEFEDDDDGGDMEEPGREEGGMMETTEGRHSSIDAEEVCGTAATTGGIEEESAQEPPEPRLEHEEDDDSEYDLRGIIFCLPPKPKPRHFGRRNAGAAGKGPKPWGMAPGGKKPSTPIVLGEEIREGFIGWMVINTANRGSSLTTILRSVNNFMARMMPKYRGDEAYSVNLTLEELRTLVDQNENDLTLEVARGTNMSLRTFWRHFVNFLREATTEGMERFLAAAQSLDVVPVVQPGFFEGVGCGGGGGAAARPTNDIFAQVELPSRRSLSGSSLFQGKAAAGQPPLTSEGSEMHHVIARKPKSKSKGRVKSKSGGGNRGSSAMIAAEFLDPFANQAENSNPKKARRASPVVMDAEARQGFMVWMRTNTKMQPVSMVTAMRTANRVIATMLTIHRSSDVGELTLDEIRTFVQEHNVAFLREVSRTANVSVKTFWRHFLRYIQVEEAVVDIYAGVNMHGAAAGSVALPSQQAAPEIPSSSLTEHQVVDGSLLTTAVATAPLTSEGMNVPAVEGGHQTIESMPAANPSETVHVTEGQVTKMEVIDIAANDIQEVMVPEVMVTEKGDGVKGADGQPQAVPEGWEPTNETHSAPYSG